ncbi:hypothetical protein [Candidatus Spongiihabitans sp.]|uniref:hypothetical protein n=1 Tax=Candidatus Spongiihabitans sp. TaxID=3101308 RepID=UPI003C7C1739
MVNKCLAKRDIKTCSGVAGHFLSCALASQFVFVLSIHHCIPTRHCPAHIIIGRAIQLNMPSGVAGLIFGEAAPFDARMTARR